MPKTHRGKPLWKTPSRSRGVCPLCGATRIKLQYPHIAADGTKLNVCKRCRKKSEQAAG